MDDECVAELGRPISSLKVTELRDELTKRSLIRTGNKKELIDRLRTSILRTSQGSDTQTTPQTNAKDDEQEAPEDLASKPNQGSEQAVDLSSAMDLSVAVDLSSSEKSSKQQSTAEPDDTNQPNSVQPEPPQTTTKDNVTQPLPTSEATENQSSDICEAVDKEEKSADTAGDDAGATEQLQKADSSTVDPILPTEEQIETTETQVAQGAQSDANNINDTETKSSSHNEATETSDQGSESSLKQVPSELPTTKENVNQTTISLKRSISDLRNNSSSTTKEKRRKWSSNATDDSLAVDSSQKTAISGGISSQKLQELIEVKQSAKVDQKDDKSNNDGATIEKPSLATEKDEQLMDEKSPKEATEIKSQDKNADPKNKSDEKSDKNDSTDHNVEVQQSQLDKQSSAAAALEDDREPTNVLLVQNLVRPFTIPQLKEVLTKHGPMIEDKFWTDKVKSRCCVTFETVEIAKLTKESLHGQQWPSSNPKTLKVSYTDETTLQKFQKMDRKPEPKVQPKEPKSTENGSNDQEPPASKLDQSLNKSLADRLGSRLGDTEGGDQVKKRLGGKVQSDETSAKTSNSNRDAVDSQPQELDDLFRKTKTVPHLFWLPLTEDQAESRKAIREERAKKAQAIESRRSPAHPPPPRRRPPPPRRSPIRHRTPPRNRSRSRSRSYMRSRSRSRSRSPLLRRSPPPRHRRSPSPLSRRRSPPGRRSPLLRRSPGPMRRSPGPSLRSPMNRRSPGLIRRSPGLVRRSPRPMGRSPPPVRRSPLLNRRSPVSSRRSPLARRQSPGLIRRSPALMRRSPLLQRRSPGLVRRSPLPMRNSSPSRRSPNRRPSPTGRRRSPLRHPSPGRGGGYGTDTQRRPQRLDRLR